MLMPYHSRTHPDQPTLIQWRHLLHTSPFASKLPCMPVPPCNNPPMLLVWPVHITRTSLLKGHHHRRRRNVLLLLGIGVLGQASYRFRVLAASKQQRQGGRTGFSFLPDDRQMILPHSKPHFRCKAFWTTLDDELHSPCARACVLLTRA